MHNCHRSPETSQLREHADLIGFEQLYERWGIAMGHVNALLARPDPGGSTPPPPSRRKRWLEPRRVAAWRDQLARTVVPELDVERIELIAELERVKAAAAAAQARLAGAMADDATARATTRDGKAQAVRSVAGQLGLARRISPTRAASMLGLARMLCADLPCTLHALASGEISEWRATLIARETAALTPTGRRTVDSALSGRVGQLGDRALAREARRLADHTDPSSIARRVKQAEADRRVTVTPAPGPAGCALARLTATMPVAQAVAIYAGLRAQAETLRGQGDPRGLGQLMSDQLFTRLTGTGTTAASDRGTAVAATSTGPGPGGAGGTALWDRATASAGGAADADTVGATQGGLAIEIGLVMSERTLFRGGTDPALLTDPQGRAYATVPAILARRLAREADRAWLTRLYAHPTSGELVAMDSKRRTFTGRLRQLLVWRDQTCRTPWCDAPIRHADHVRAWAANGPTDLRNGAGLCEACNYRKQAPGWHTDIITPPGTGQIIQISTPTGHHYHSEPPRAPGHQEHTLEDDVQNHLNDRDDGIGGAA